VGPPQPESPAKSAGLDHAQNNGHGHHSHNHSHSPEHDHGHGHGHGWAHGHAEGGSAQRALWLALILTGLFVFVEAATGFMSGSLALLADAGHMLADTAALGLALAAQRFAARPRTAQSTFGFRRAEVLAAFVNGMTLTAVAALIIKEAIERWLHPRTVDALPVIWTACLGLLVNMLVAWILSRGQRENVNVRAALAHVLSDALASIGALGAGLAVLFGGWARIDSALSVVIALLVASSGFRVVRETSGILLEGAPRHLDVAAIQKTIAETPGVLELHDLHVWQISSRFDALSVHITIEPGRHGTDMCKSVAERIKTEHRIEHVTIQPESAPPHEVVQVRRSRDGKKLTTGA